MHGENPPLNTTELNAREDCELVMANEWIAINLPNVEKVRPPPSRSAKEYLCVDCDDTSSSRDAWVMVHKEGGAGAGTGTEGQCAQQSAQRWTDRMICVSRPHGHRLVV